ncbi:hypothetical protein F4861DRAFT_59860 [Xylaria intraflava]|nr:hypothetical protein F4861DRAFT_59860 [Xylaria intraflava]
MLIATQSNPSPSPLSSPAGSDLVIETSLTTHSLTQPRNPIRGYNKPRILSAVVGARSIGLVPYPHECMPACMRPRLPCFDAAREKEKNKITPMIPRMIVVPPRPARLICELLAYSASKRQPLVNAVYRPRGTTIRRHTHTGTDTLEFTIIHRRAMSNSGCPLRSLFSAFPKCTAGGQPMGSAAAADLLHGANCLCARMVDITANHK